MEVDLGPLGPDALAEHAPGGPVPGRAGRRNSSGLTIMNTRTRTTAASDHQPIHSRLQMARTSSGRTANRVQTLTGLAWRIQPSPCSPNSLVTETLMGTSCVGVPRPSIRRAAARRIGRVTGRAGAGSARLDETPSFTNTLRRW